MKPSTALSSYYDRAEVSNSDLSWLKGQLYPKESTPDPTEAYSFGSLIDAMLTEPDRVNYYKHTLDGQRIKSEIFQRAKDMKRPFWSDSFCSWLATEADGQKVDIVAGKVFNFRGYEFAMDVRCKWDLWRKDWGWGGDIKSTVATTQEQFEAAARYFDYDRQRAWYMDIAGAERDVLIGISKANNKIFKIFINRQSEFYLTGKQKYMELAFRYHLLFGNTKAA